MKNNLHFLRCTKLIVIFIGLIMCTLLSANATNKQTVAPKKQISNTVSLKSTNAKLIDVLRDIQNQTSIGYSIDGTINPNKIDKISIELNNASIPEALSQLSKTTHLSFRLIDGAILVSATPQAFPTTTQLTQNPIEVKGKVVDEKGKPVVGATLISASGAGTITDNDGQFVLNLTKAEEVEVSCVGYVTVIKNITASKDNLVIEMQKDEMDVEEVVVNGVFARKAGTFTGSVTTIKAEDIKRVSNSNALTALRNLDPSIIFVDNLEFGSDPNQLPDMSIRGKSSLDIEDNNLRDFQGDPNAPLFILDGFEVTMQRVLDLDMDRIETMTILKDASAKAIYGSKAANGVIIIELRKTPAGKLRVTYNGSVEIQSPDLSSYNLTNAAEKLEVEKMAGQFVDRNFVTSTQQTLNQLYNQRLTFVTSGIDTDWLSKPLQSGVGTKHGVSIDLGEGALKTIIDFSYQNVKGTMKGSDRTNMSGGITVSYRYNKFLFRNSLTILSNTSNDSKYGSFSEYAALNPYYTPYDAEGRITENIVPELEDLDYLGSLWYGNVGYVANPLYNAELNTVLRDKYTDITNNFELQYFVNQSFKITTRLGVTNVKKTSDDFYPANHLKFNSYTGEDYFRKGSYDYSTGNDNNFSAQVDLQYNKELRPKHMLYTNAGYQISEIISTLNSFSAEGFPNDKMSDIMFALQYRDDTKPTGNDSTKRELGYYLSVNYSYDNRINIDGTFRQSASSLYGANTRWGAFWSTGVSWNIHNEKWLSGTDITNMRLRATVGSTGSQSTSPYNGIASYSYFLEEMYGGILAAELTGMRNDDLKWQVKVDTNFGIDFTLLNKLSLSVDYYNGVTKNAVNPLTLAPSTGFTTVKENAGKIKNTGFDVKFRYTAWQIPSERSSLSFTVGFVNNKSELLEISDAMKDYNAQQELLFEDSPDMPVAKYYDGVSMTAIWAMKSLGIDPVNGNEVYLRKNADGEYYRTYSYSVTGQEIVGDTSPTIQGNASINFERKGFAFNCVLRYQFGAQMYNSTLVSKVENANLSNNVDRRVYTERWQNPGDIALFKAINSDEASLALYGAADKTISPTTSATSRFVQDRNELSISSVQLSYDFYRHKFVKQMGMERMRIALNTNDLLMLSSIETERGTSYPFAHVVNASLSITF